MNLEILDSRDWWVQDFLPADKKQSQTWQQIEKQDTEPGAQEMSQLLKSPNYWNRPDHFNFTIFLSFSTSVMRDDIFHSAWFVTIGF